METVVIPILLGAVLVLGVVVIILLVRHRPRIARLSPEERAELAGPMPPMQRRAWIGFGISTLAAAAILILLIPRGAAEYWNNDRLRMTIVWIFIGGLALYMATILPAFASRQTLDERDKTVLSHAPNFQAGAILVTLAGWIVTLPKMFRSAGAIPVVYLYLIFGSVILVYMISQAVGILIGYWLAARHG